MKNFRKVDTGLYRSGRIDESSFKTLQKHNITLVIDLRFKEEVEEFPDLLPEGVDYLNIPLVEKDNTALPKSFEDFLTSEKIYTIYDTYKAISECPSFDDNVQKVLKVINEHDYSKGGVLFHCTSGKDRTGVVSALYLKSKGKPISYIHKDYLKSNRGYFLSAVTAYFVVLSKTHNKQKAKEVYNFFHLKKEYIDLFIK